MFCSDKIKQLLLQWTPPDSALRSFCSCKSNVRRDRIDPLPKTESVPDVDESLENGDNNPGEDSAQD